ncbi:MAG: sugar ABC transporter permease [Alicyclobacillus herbarius]|uniref:carbohydrate ABC transporter permease n=1 Tax=Alicyclobacillus herbarius TaxID=122960 RepID=UPI0023543FD0|nr:sugar ABC transporter permease [Alicyclobacillus herbarius]MCL6632571.1 sugar ABC transporter permease [Alicyclobacillus herbarius]
MADNAVSLSVHTNIRVRKRRSAARVAFWFLLPNLIGFICFTLLPIVMALGLSLFKWSLTSPPEFVGLSNYVTLFVHDVLFGQVLFHTVYYVAVYVTLNLVVSLSFAVWLNRKIKGIQVFRAVLFLPVLVPPVAISMVWQWLYNPDYGLIDSVLKSLGLSGPNWLGNEHWAMPALVLMSVWEQFGYNMLIFLAGLQSVSRDLLEAAAIDGAGRWRRFWRIQLPMISPSVFFGMVMTLITSFQTFDQVFVLTNGGPGDATDVLGLYIYNNAFNYFKIGYGSTIAVVMFLIIMIVTMIQLRLQKRWVHYEAS